MADKKPCEKCGKEVTVIPHIRKRHTENCKGDQMIAEPKTIIPVVEVKEKVQVEAKPVKAATDEIKNLIEVAQRKEAEYLRAPEAFISDDSADEHMELRKIYAPNTIDRQDAKGNLIEKAKRSAYIADKDAIKLAAQRGYVPVTDESGELVRTRHGDILTTIPIERSEAAQAASAQKSESIMAGHENAAGVKGNSDMSDVKTEIATRTKLGE